MILDGIQQIIADTDNKMSCSIKFQLKPSTLFLTSCDVLRPWAIL